MAKINWFPGHMAKALRDMAEEVKKVDMIIYVLDARAPMSSVNPEFLAIIGEKPILILDDVFSELDSFRQRKLYEIFEDAQVLMTGTNFKFKPENSYLNLVVNNAVIKSQKRN